MNKSLRSLLPKCIVLLFIITVFMPFGSYASDENEVVDFFVPDFETSPDSHVPSFKTPPADMVTNKTRPKYIPTFETPPAGMIIKKTRPEYIPTFETPPVNTVTKKTKDAKIGRPSHLATTGPEALLLFFPSMLSAGFLVSSRKKK